MTSDHHTPLNPAVAAAIRELQDLISAQYPEATFAVEDGFDPPGTYLIATVDVPDTDVVFSLVVERLLDFQVEEGLPVYVTTIRPIARVIEELQARGLLMPHAPAPR